MSNVIRRRPGMTFEQREKAIGMLIGKRRCSAFQRHESKAAGRPFIYIFLTTSSRRNRFLSSRKLGRLLRNATGTRVCYGTVRNRLHAARLKACRPYVPVT